MEEENVVEEVGRVKISDEVIAVIAGVASSDIIGVSSMGNSMVGGIAGFLGGKKNISKGIKVDIKDEGVTIDIHIVVMYGVRIPEMAWTIQEKVKKEVEKITGLDVLKVNIHIDGVSMEKEKGEETVIEEQEDEDI